MRMQVLVCHADGTQELVEREVPENYFEELRGTAESAQE